MEIFINVVVKTALNKEDILKMFEIDISKLPKYLM